MGVGTYGFRPLSYVWRKMTVVHNNPHPLAMKVLVPKNEEIAKKFGEVRIEDWDDRVAGSTWRERAQRGTEVDAYTNETVDLVPGTASDFEVVRCHSTATGELILLHDDWL
jgi:hypothetical protein